MYQCILADSPWTYRNKMLRMKSTGHGASAQYHTMNLRDICDFPFTHPGQIHQADGTVIPFSEQAPLHTHFAAHAHLWLWATNTFLHPAFEVMRAWGFTYKTTLTWVKGRLEVVNTPEALTARLVSQIGQGYYLRNNTEHLLFGVRGHCPARVKSLPTAFIAARGDQHSRKPEEAYGFAEQLSPGPYLEIFARRRRPHWSAIGDQL